MIEPYYDRDGITIYNADCRAVLPGLPQVDLVLTDPPYGISYQTSWTSKSDPKRKAIANDRDLSLVEQVWPQCLKSLRDDRHWYAFATLRPRCFAAGAWNIPAQTNVSLG